MVDPKIYALMAQAAIKAMKELAVERIELSPLSLAQRLAEREEAEKALGLLAAGENRNPVASAPVTVASSEVGEEAEWLSNIKEAFLDVLTGLDQDVNPTYTEQVHQLKRRVAESKNIHFLFALRRELTAVVQRFAQLAFEDRRRAASFVTEVVVHLGQLDAALDASIDHVDDFRVRNTDFYVDLDGQMDGIEQTTREGGLEQIKEVILARINSVKSAIQSKKISDDQLLEETNGELTKLQRELRSVKERVQLVEDEKKALAAKARIDPLTGAFNRRALEERLSSDMSLFQRHGRTFALILFDVDRFKMVNDTFGHTVGDRVLTEIVNQIKPVLRKSDLLARYGGDEFAIIASESTAATAQTAAEKIRRLIEEIEFSILGQKTPVTLSFGVTEAINGDIAPLSVLDRADQALYRAKKEGRNRVVLG